MLICEHVDMRAHQNTSMSECKHVSMQARQDASTSVCKHVSMQARQYASMSVCKHVCMQARRYASMSVFKYFGLHIPQVVLTSGCAYLKFAHASGLRVPQVCAYPDMRMP